MVKIVRRKAATIDGLRERLKAHLGQRSPKVKCRHCDGTGQGTIDVNLVAAELGVAATTLYSFASKAKGRLTLEAGLKLLAWLDELERNALDELDEEHEPTDPDQVDRERDRLRVVRNDAAQKAAVAAIEARHRPIQAPS